MGGGNRRSAFPVFNRIPSTATRELGRLPTMSQPIERSGPSALSKPGWRRAIIAAISALDPVERRVQEGSLIAAFTGLPGFAGAETVLLYISAFPEELKTGELLTYASDAGKQVLCPRVARAARPLR